MGVSNYTPTGISHATSVDFSKRSVNQPVHIVQYDRSLPILAVSLYNNGQLYHLSEDMEVSIRLGKPDRTFVYNKALGCDSTRTIVYFEITQQMSLFDGEFYPVIEIMDGEQIANSSTIYLVVDRNPVQHDYIESTIEYKELIDYRDEAVKAGKEAKASEEASKLSETNAKESENESLKYSNLSKSYAVGTDNAIRENDAEDNAKTYCETAKISAGNAKQSETNAKQSETNAKTYLDKIIEKVDVVVDTEMSDTSENPVQNKVIKKYVDDHSADVSDMIGATADKNGVHGLVPAPQIGDEKKALLGDGTWGSVDAIFTYKTKEEYDAAVENDEIPDGAKVIKEYDDGDLAAIIDIDTAMSDTSENPVQNKVIKKYVDSKQVEVPIADKGTAGIVKPADGLIITEDGTLKVSLDGTTLTMDQVDNVIKLADTLKEKINGALPSANIVNNLTTTEAGFALDARQANPNVSGSLGAKIQHVQNYAVKVSVTDIFNKNSLHVTTNDNKTVSATASWITVAGDCDQLYVSIPSVPAGKTSISIGLSMPANSHVVLNVYGTNGQNIVYPSGCIFSNNTSNSKNINFPVIISENRTGAHSILIKVLVISGI